MKNQDSLRQEQFLNVIDRDEAERRFQAATKQLALVRTFNDRESDLHGSVSMQANNRTVAQGVGSHYGGARTVLQGS